MTATPARAAMASVATASALLVLKGWAAWASGSVALLGSLADTGLDLLASLVTLAGIRIAAMPADHDHRFGHGKAEALAALFQMALVLASAIGIAVRAVQALGADTVPHDTGIGIAVSIVAMGLTALLLMYQRAAIRASGSLAIRADHIHYQSDFLLNGGVIVALLLEGSLGLRGADPLFGLAIALWLGWNALKATRLSIDQLMDREWPDDRRDHFMAIVARHPAVIGVHDLRTRSAGGVDFAQFHIWVAPEMTVREAHDVMDAVERSLAPEFPGAEILIHVDPAGQVDAEGVLPSRLAEEGLR